MSRWRSFVDVLDEILTDRTAAEASSSGSAGDQTQVASAPLFTYKSHSRNRFWGVQGPYQPTAASQDAHVVETPSPTAAELRDTVAHASREMRDAEGPRTSRLLKPVEETALQTLVQLGAALDRSFTPRELRSTFRALAQRYHPDRHPHVTDAERMRLGATFAELTQAYGVLHDTTH